MESSAHRLNPANGRIHPTAGFVEVSIGDNGVGIAPENQEDVLRGIPSSGDSCELELVETFADQLI
jgi:hypothetical protein